MIPQGTLPVNLDYFTGLHSRIEGCTSCAELNGVTAEAYASISGTVAAINAQIAALQPILALLTAPGANLTQIVTWIQNYITAVLTPLYKPYLVYPTQLAQISTQMAALPALISAKMAQFPSCSVPIPPIPGLP